mmetsp:Transcript_124781/g.398847  ORF Transcript_124781/g.398847 Transcript_124781/m.398847 type:complete len:321 (+) Transcript_124781:43-1005(+)
MSSVSSDTEEVASVSGWPSFLSSYTTEQRVVVQSPRLRIPELVMWLVILLYSILFLQVFKLQMFDRAAVEANPYVYTEASMVNVRCETPTEDCVDVVRNRSDLKTFPYCAKEPTLNISGCVPLYGMFAAGLHTQFVSTMATRVEQVRSDIQQPWSTNNISRKYVVGAELVRVGLVHEFNTPGWQRSGMVGLLDPLEGPLCQLPCEDSDGMECNVPRLAPGCNDSDILNLPWADYLPLHVLLAAADRARRRSLRRLGLGPCAEAHAPLRSFAFLGRRLIHRHRVFRHRLHRLLDEGQLGPNTEIRDPPSPDDRGGAAVLRT